MRLTFRTASTALVCFALLTACGDDDGGADSGVGMDSGPRDSSVPVCETTGPEDNAAACMDACDNDDDGAADCDDIGCCDLRTDCPATSFCGGGADDGGVMACATEGPETTVAACSDGCDNDGNGFFDCNDFDCCDSRTDCPATTSCGRGFDGGMPMNLTIEQLQNPADPMHPAVGARISVDQADMIALTPRLLVGSPGGTDAEAGICRWVVWIGSAVTDDFTAIQVQEIIDRPAATSCFSLPVGKISDDFAPGDAVTSIANASYREFCAGPMGPAPVPCTDFEQSYILLGGSATITRGAAGTAPTPTVVEVAELAGPAGAPGTRALALEGGLLRVEDVTITTMMDGTFTNYFASAPSVELGIQVSNFVTTRCVRDELSRLATAGETVTLTGILVPNFGRWSLRLRDETDVDGLTCTPAP